MKKNNFIPIEKYYALKSVFEDIWGKSAYQKLKHCANLKIWKRYAERTLLGSRIAIQETILVIDENWQEDAHNIISYGIQLIKSAKSFDELFQALSSSYIQLSFHQIGFMPRKPSNFRRQLRKEHWKLDFSRSVQYVQNAEQKKNLIEIMQSKNKAEFKQ